MSFRNSNRKRDIMNFSGNSFVTLLRCRLYTTAFFGETENTKMILMKVFHIKKWFKNKYFLLKSNRFDQLYFVEIFSVKILHRI